MIGHKRAAFTRSHTGFTPLTRRITRTSLIEAAMASRRTALIAAVATLAGVAMLLALNHSTSEDQGSRMLAGNACKETDDDPYAPIREPIFSGVCPSLQHASTPSTSQLIPCLRAQVVNIGNLVGATVLLLVLGALAAGAGIGGGGLFVPIFAFILLDQNAKAAVPLSKACILGGAIGNYVTLGWARHPDADKGIERPMIDYEASTFMQVRHANPCEGVPAPVLTLPNVAERRAPRSDLWSTAQYSPARDLDHHLLGWPAIVQRVQDPEEGNNEVQSRDGEDDERSCFTRGDEGGSRGVGWC